MKIIPATKEVPATIKLEDSIYEADELAKAGSADLTEREAEGEEDKPTPETTEADETLLAEIAAGVDGIEEFKPELVDTGAIEEETALLETGSAAAG
jgi:hypothetical protein